MKDLEQFDTKTLIEMATAEVHRLSELWQNAMKQIDDKQEQMFGKAA